MTKGRNCSLDYMLNKDWVKNTLRIDKDVLYVVGGLYGNNFALELINSKAEKENAQIIFNGDMHWFDINKDDFLTVENNSIKGIMLLGNVEYELINSKDNLGCGCNYPEDVSEGIVERSNTIHQMMKDNLGNDDILEEIQLRDKTLSVEFLNKKIAITHGDEKSMSGWQCSHSSLQKKERQDELNTWLDDNKVDILATTHTCLPALYNNDKHIVVNNGAAGMANVKDSTYGLITRIAKTPSEDAIVSEKIDNIYVELVKIDFSIEKFLEWFESVWDDNSPASISYKKRIIHGTSLEISNIKV